MFLLHSLLFVLFLCLVVRLPLARISLLLPCNKLPAVSILWSRLHTLNKASDNVNTQCTRYVCCRRLLTLLLNNRPNSSSYAILIVLLHQYTSTITNQGLDRKS